MTYFLSFTPMIRFIVGLGLFITPLASAHAMFIEDLTLPKNVPAAVTEQKTETVTPAPNATETETEMPKAVVMPVSAPSTLANIPDGLLSRAAFTAMLVQKMYTKGEIDVCYWTIAPSVPPSFTLVFSDVQTTDMYAKELCVAMRDGLIRGYGDGSFRPNQAVTFAEASKILSRSYALAPYADADQVSAWYFPYVTALTAKNAVPTNIVSLNQKMTKADTAEMLDRVHNGITSRPSQTATKLMPPAPVAQPKPAVSTSTSSKPTSGQSSSAHSSTVIKSSKKGTAVSSVASETPAMTSSSKRSLWDLF